MNCLTRPGSLTITFAANVSTRPSAWAVAAKISLWIE